MSKCPHACTCGMAGGKIIISSELGIGLIGPSTDAGRLTFENEGSLRSMEKDTMSTITIYNRGRGSSKFMNSIAS